MLKLEPGRVYNIRVLDVEVKKSRTSFHLQKGGTFYNYMISVQITGMDSGLVEYSCKRETVEEVMEHDFIPGAYQLMKVKKCSDLGCEVEVVQDTFAPPKSVSGKEIPMPQSQVPVEKNIYSTSFSGSNIMFATAYSKDLLVAEISRQPEGYRVTEDDIQRMITNAGKIALGIAEYCGL